MASDTVISVKNVSKRFLLPHERQSSIKSSIVGIFRKKDKSVEIQHALKDISFDIKKGEFFGIVGRNGSGKSTLLKMLAGVYQPTSGEITVQGRLVPFIELGVGFNPELTGRENVYLNGALLGFSKKEIDAMYDSIVEFAELERFMDQKLKNYSSGMQVRLAFSVATRAKAEILIVDEVLAVGDADFQRKCYDYFKKIKKDNNITVVFVTHDMSAVREYCDKAILIEKGEIQAEGSPNDIADKYLQLFNGSNTVVDNDEHWGTGEVRMAGVKIESSKENIKFEMDLISNIDLGKFIIGYNFRNGNGTTIMGGNSMNAVESIGQTKIAKGETKHITFDTPNFLGSGEYTLEIAVKKDDGIILDKMTNAGHVKVAKVESYYPTIALAKMRIKHVQGGEYNA